MQLRERQVDNGVVVELSGEGIGAEPSILKPFVVALLRRGHRHIVLDFEHLHAMDSTCLAELIATYKAIVDAGGVLKLSALNAQVRRLLHVTKVDTLLEVHDSATDAIASFDRPADV